MTRSNVILSKVSISSEIVANLHPSAARPAVFISSTTYDPHVALFSLAPLGGPRCAKRTSLLGKLTRGGLGKPLGRGEGYSGPPRFNGRSQEREKITLAKKGGRPPGLPSPRRITSSLRTKCEANSQCPLHPTCQSSKIGYAQPLRSITLISIPATLHPQSSILN